MELEKPTLARALKKYPFAIRIFRRIKFGLFFDSIRRKIRGTGNIIRYRGAILSAVSFDICGDGNKIEIGENSVLKGVIFHVYGNRHTIIIGKNCEFLHGGILWMEDEMGVLEIGDNALVRDAHFAVTENGSKLFIGSDSAIGDEVEIRTGDSHSIIDAATGRRINYAEDVHIGRHCGIAPRSIILKGVHLGENTAVAVASLVTKGEYEPGVILAGNPARIVKCGTTWDLKRMPKPGLGEYPA